MLSKYAHLRCLCLCNYFCLHTKTRKSRWMVTPFCFQQRRPNSGKTNGSSNHNPKDSKPKHCPLQTTLDDGTFPWDPFPRLSFD